MEPNRESIFKSTLRTFFKAFAAILGIFVAFIPFFILSSIGAKDIHVEPKNTLTILPDLQEQRKFLSSGPVVLQVNINGIVGSPELNGEIIRHQLVESRSGILSGDRVKAVLLQVNSPGGGVTDCNTIYELLLAYKQKYKVPVYAYVNGLCASAAMYISCAADKIHSSPVSVIGSVGVIMGPFFNIKEALQQFGIHTKTLKQGKNKDMMSPFKEWTPQDPVALEDITAYLYNRFVNIVSSARPKLTPSLLKNELGANVYDALKAQELGYVDEGNSSYKIALKELLQAANIDPASSYQVVELTPKKVWLKDFLQGSPLFTGKLKHQFFSSSIEEIKDPLLYLYDPTTP